MPADERTPGAGVTGDPAGGGSVSAAARFVAELASAGVRDVVLCPGSRSAPLAYALHAAERSGLLRLHVRHDERTAAFLALGVGRATPSNPAAVVTTSGTAVANLLPAAQEAHHGRVPLLLISADRPLRLRGTWANQTSDLQADLFTAVAVARWDCELADLGHAAIRRLAGEAVSASRGLRERAAGPVHVNVCLDEPLQPPTGQTVQLPDIDQHPLATPPSAAMIEPLRQGPRTVVVAGDGAGPAARLLAEQGGWPLLAEPSSSARTGPNLIAGYRLLLPRNGFADQIERVIVYGRPTLSRPVTRLLDSPAVDLVQIVDRDDDPGPGRPSRRVTGVAVEAGPTVEDGWLQHWQAAGHALDAHLATVLAGWPRPVGPAVAAAVAAATESTQALVLGASNPIRDLDLAGGPIADGALVVANRGLAGIDGTVSTAVGVAAATGRPTRTLVGDLTFLHDLTGLAVPAGERDRVRLQIIVLNDDGGGIFATLEHGEHPASFERIFATPTGADLERLATGFGAAYRRVHTVAELADALVEVPVGVQVVEVPACRDDLRPLHRMLAAGLGSGSTDSRA